jgi:hypothetical protein
LDLIITLRSTISLSFLSNASFNCVVSVASAGLDSVAVSPAFAAAGVSEYQRSEAATGCLIGARDVGCEMGRTAALEARNSVL